MKRIQCVFLCFSILITLCACVAKESGQQNDMLFYYCKVILSYNEPDTVIACEYRNPEDISRDIPQIIQAYLSGPISQSLTCLFPENTTLSNFAETEDGLRITLSKDCTGMEKVDLILACSCLAKTLMPYTNADSIMFLADEGFENMDVPLVFSRNSIITDKEISITD